MVMRPPTQGGDVAAQPYRASAPVIIRGNSAAENPAKRTAAATAGGQHTGSPGRWDGLPTQN